MMMMISCQCSEAKTEKLLELQQDWVALAEPLRKPRTAVAVAGLKKLQIPSPL